MKIQHPKLTKELASKKLHNVFFDDDFILENCEICNSSLKGEVLDRLGIYNAHVKDCDLSQSYFDKFTVNKDDLKGCKISRNQAIQFAGLMGLRIVD